MHNFNPLKIPLVFSRCCLLAEGQRNLIRTNMFAHQEFPQVFVVGNDSIVDDNELCRPERSLYGTYDIIYQSEIH